MSKNEIVTPDLGGSTDVSVIEVLVKPGDRVEVDTSIVTLESDKATLDIPAGLAGVIHSLAVKVGDKVETGSLLAKIDINGQAEETKKELKQEQSSDSSQAQVDKSAKGAQQASSSSVVIEQSEKNEDEDEDGLDEQSTHATDVHAGPGVRRLARELGVDLHNVTGSGPKQRILKDDVHYYVKQRMSQMQMGSSIAAPTIPVIDFSQFGAIDTQALSRIKKISGKHLTRNWQTIPHVTQFGDADITKLEHFRQSQKAEMQKQQVKLTPLAFIMKAVVVALKAFPTFNASLDANGENLIIKNYYHIGVAVDTPDGLVVPVIRNVDQKGLIALAKELAEVSERARQKKLLPQDMQGGSFSISSLGGIGGTAFTPIINAPEVAILGVSKAQYQPVYDEGVFVPRLMLPLSLSYDHRVIDGAEGARFIMYLISLLADIRHLLL